MGKRIISQRRGRGTSRYRAPSHRYLTAVKYPNVTGSEGRIEDIVHCPGHSSPLIRVRFEDGTEIFNMAPLGVRVGDAINTKDTEPAPGSIVCLKDLVEGTLIYNIESVPGDGGKFVRTSGSSAKVVARQGDKIAVIMPSKRTKLFSPSCRATVGTIAGGGRLEKPFVKAGNKFFKMKARNKLWPRSEGVRMNAVDHPYGNSQSSNKGRPTIARKHAPPGAKVGKIRPRRTGRKVGRASRMVR